MSNRNDTNNYATDDTSNNTNIIGNAPKRPALRILSPEYLDSGSNSNLPDSGRSIHSFIRNRRLQLGVQYRKRIRRAKQMEAALEDCPPPDSLWRSYQNSSIEVEAFDLESCYNDSVLFEFTRELVDHAAAAQICSDQGIPIDSSITLPRSFLLDEIHLAASLHCLRLQEELGRSVERADCPAPFERIKPADRVNRSTIKTLFNYTKICWLNPVKREASIVPDESEGCGDDSDSDSNSEPEIKDKLSSSSSEDGEEAESEEESDSSFDWERGTRNDPNFDAICRRVLNNVPKFLEPCANYYDGSDRFGADALWSFDTSALLAFGLLAETFMSKMIDAHFEKHGENSDGFMDELVEMDLDDYIIDKIEGEELDDY